METADGVVVIDTGLQDDDSLFNCIRQTTMTPIQYVIYTHGHNDHTGGTRALFTDSNPAIIGHANLPVRQQRYTRVASHMARISTWQ